MDYYQPAVEQLYEIMTPIIDTTGKMNKFIEVFGVSEEIISPFGKKMHNQKSYFSPLMTTIQCW